MQGFCQQLCDASVFMCCACLPHIQCPLLQQQQHGADKGNMLALRIAISSRPRLCWAHMCAPGSACPPPLQCCLRS